MGKTHVEAAEAAAADVRPYPVVGFLALLVGVESLADERTQKAAVLRLAKNDRVARVALPAGVRRVIAHGRHADPRDHRVLGCVNHFIDAARLETLRIFHRFSVRGKVPIRARDLRAGAVESVADRHAPSRRIGHGVSSHRAIAERIGSGPAIYLDLGTHHPGDPAEHGRVEQTHQSGFVGQIELPADQHERISLFEHPRIAEVLGRPHRIGAAATAELEQRRMPAVGDFHEQRPVTFGRVLGAHHQQIRGEFDESLGVTRRAVEIDDRAVRGVVRIEREVDLPRDPFRARDRKVGALGNIDLGDGRREQGRAEQERTKSKQR